MSNLIPFQFDGRSISVVEISGEPWFIAKEIADILGYSDSEAMTRKLDEDEKQNLQIVGYGNRGITVINEAGLYSCILTSQKSEAKPFKRWVTHEVLPSIRKTGGYAASQSVQTIEATKLFKPMFQIARMIGCDKQAAAISANQAVTAVSGTNLLALMGQTHIEASNQDAMFFTPSELGKRIEVSGRGMNLLLAEAGLQMKQGETWTPTDAGKDFCRIFDTGKRHSTGTPVQQVKWAENVLALVQKAA